MAKRYFEDFEVGAVWHIGEHVVSRDEIIAFASRWDPQPFHIDEPAADASIFRGLTASSCHTYSISALIMHQNEYEIAAVAMLGAELRFPNPVRPGDRLTQTSECLETRLSRSHPHLGIVKTRTTLNNQSERPVLAIDSSFLVERRDPPRP
jgi:acyl dehydratase